MAFDHGDRISASERVASSILGACIGDALAAPIHWYYDLQKMRSDLKESFPMSSKDDKGRLATFCQVPPGLKHPDSWLYFKSYDPIKDPLGITHGKEERWAEPGTFYHGDLAAGEATTTVQLALLLARSLTDLGAYDYSDFLNRSLFGTRAPQIARDHARPRGGQVRAAHDDPGGQPRHVPRGARAALLPRAPRRRGAAPPRPARRGLPQVPPAMLLHAPLFPSGAQGRSAQSMRASRWHK